MLRLRSAYLALASGVLMTLSGCLSNNTCDSSPMFPRLFRSARQTTVVSGEHDCECHSSHMPRMFDVPPGQGPFMGPPAQGPFMGPPGQGPFIGPPPAPAPTMTPIPITNMPNAPPPIVTRSPFAVPAPYNP